jgi:hypothetical protein
MSINPCYWISAQKPTIDIAKLALCHNRPEPVVMQLYALALLKFAADLRLSYRLDTLQHVLQTKYYSIS